MAARWKGVDESTRNEIEIVMNTLLNDIEKRIELNVINKEKELLKNIKMARPETFFPAHHRGSNRRHPQLGPKVEKC